MLILTATHTAHTHSWIVRCFQFQYFYTHFQRLISNSY